jgi:hypothetical protein
MKTITEKEYRSYLVHQESFTTRLWEIFVEYAKIQSLDLGSCYELIRIDDAGVLYEGWSYGAIYSLLPAKFIYDREGWEESLRLKSEEDESEKELAKVKLVEFEKQQIDAADKIRKILARFPEIKGEISK